MRKFIILFVLLLNTAFISAQVTKESSLRIVQNFIHTIESGDRHAIADIVHYPLKRGASTPAISDKAEFIARFDEIFDENILKIIIDSDPATDWSEMGWQGIMLLDGEIWLDYDGKLIAVNYASKTASETIHSRFQPTPLPFVFEQWDRWYNEQPYNDLMTTDQFKFYRVEENPSLYQALSDHPLHDGFMSYLFFVLSYGDGWNCYLLFSKYFDEEYPVYGERVKFYDIVCLRGDQIISSLWVGYLPDMNENRKSFEIDESLNVTVYDESVILEETNIPIVRERLKTESFHVENDGAISKK